VAYDEDLADRIRELIGAGSPFSEKRMFGGLAFLVGGHLAIAASGQGGVLVRADPAKMDKLVATTAARVAEMRGRPMSGWLRVAPEHLRTKRQLSRWVTVGASYARSLPAKHQEGSRTNMATKKTSEAKSPSELIDGRIEELGDWRGETLSRLRDLVKQADPDVVEEWKWRGVPTWYHDGIICTGESYKAIVKVTFAKGASLDDPKGLFNSSLDGNVRRAIDFPEGAKVNATAFKALVRAAVKLNESKAKKK
jgi:TfoX/Sxy family transcriptional regulator of competence genes